MGQQGRKEVVDTIIATLGIPVLISKNLKER